MKDQSELTGGKLRTEGLDLSFLLLSEFVDLEELIRVKRFVPFSFLSVRFEEKRNMEESDDEDFLRCFRCLDKIMIKSTDTNVYLGLGGETVELPFI